VRALNSVNQRYEVSLFNRKLIGESPILNCNVNKFTNEVFMSDQYIVARTRLDNYIISTVKLPDWPAQAPIVTNEAPEWVKSTIYETMVFEVDADGKVTDRDMNVWVRYTTRDEAVIGHESIVSEWSVKTVI
jgi:hypothetical protein